MSELFPLPPEPANIDEDLKHLREKHPSLNNWYLNVHMREEWLSVKNFFEDAWVEFKEFADPDFHTEFQVSFFSRAWEIYLFKVLRIYNFHFVKQSKQAPNPDFKIQLADRFLFVEAVNAGKGEGKNEVITFSDRLAEVPSGTFISSGGHIDDDHHPKVRRITSALKEKIKNYHSGHSSVVGVDDYYVFAISGAEIDASMRPEAIILEVVMGLNPALHLPRMSDGSLGEAYQTTRNVIPTTDGLGVIEINLFGKEEYKEISGILFCGRDAVNNILQGCNDEEIIFVHNPNANASKRMPLDVFAMFTQITISPTHYDRHPPTN